MLQYAMQYVLLIVLQRVAVVAVVCRAQQTIAATATRCNTLQHILQHILQHLLQHTE